VEEAAVDTEVGEEVVDTEEAEMMDTEVGEEVAMAAVEAAVAVVDTTTMEVAAAAAMEVLVVAAAAAATMMVVRADKKSHPDSLNADWMNIANFGLSLRNHRLWR